MSGAEAALVLGLISASIQIIQGAKSVYDAAKDTKGQPEAFRQVAARLPLVIEILRNARDKTQILDESAQAALKPVLESCKLKAGGLEKIFRQVIRKDDDKWYDRYKKAVDSLGKGNKVESLMKDILRDIQVLACERLRGIATDAQVKELQEAIKAMNGMPSSIPEDGWGINQTHSGSGDNIGHTGSGVMNIHKGGGDLYHNVIAGGATFGDNPQNPTFNITNNIVQPEHKPQPQDIWMVPRSPNTLFTGQKGVLATLQKALCDNNPLDDSLPKRFVITGIGGAGKSELCLKFASINRKRFRRIFWIDASSFSTIEQGYINAAKLCGVQSDYQSAKVFFDNMKDLYLLVLDNADDIKLNLDPYLPSGTSSTTLITSRNYQIERYATSGKERLEKLEWEDSIELLLKASRTPQTKWVEHRDDAEAVIQILSQHALAIVQAGAFIEQDLCTLEEYPTEYKRQRRQLLEFHVDQANCTYGDVYATFEVSAKYLENFKSTNQSYADALELLGILAHLYFVGVPEAMFTRAWKYAQTISLESTPPDEINSFSQWHVSKLPHILRRHDSVEDMDITALRRARNVLGSFAFINVHPETKRHLNAPIGTRVG